jgi:hypothetical protein
LAKLKIKNAILHFEARCRPESLYKKVDDAEFAIPIEINLRLCGEEIPALINSSYNINLIREYVNICLGFELDEISINKAPLYRSISSKLYPPGKSTLNKVYLNRSKLKNNPYLAEIIITKPIGSDLDSNFNILLVTVRKDINSTLDEMKDILNNTLNCIKLEYI